MKPNFSLILSSEGLSLLHRTYSGWARVGDVAFDVPDLPGAITALQERAARLPGDATCKLIIPEEQIKYLSLDAAGDPDTAVRAALDGATPYAVDDLEYDWTAEGGTIRVAAVALETLAEAESFATEHGFEPVSFAAIPENGDFRGEPFFGATRWAATGLPEGTKIERDSAPIRITGDADMPDGALEDDTPVAAAATQAVAEAGPAPRQDVPAATTPAPAQPVAKPANADAKGAEPAEAQSSPKTPGDTKPAIAASGASKSADKPATGPGTEAADAPAAPASFSSIRASRTLEGPAKAPLVAGEARLGRLGGADAAGPKTAQAGTGTAPPLPSPASDGVTDPALMAELAASLRPDPEARLDRDASTDQTAPEAQSASGTGLPGLFGKRPANDVQAKTAKSQGTASQRNHDEKQRMTVFGARQSEVRGKPRFLGLILTAILLLCLVGVAAWASVFLDDGLARLFRGADTKLADAPAASETENDPTAQESTDAAPALIAPLPSGDTGAAPRIASLPEGNVQRPEVTTLPDRPLPLSPSEALARYAATGIWQMAPSPPETPGAGAPITDLYQVSLDPGISLGLPATLPRRMPDGRDTAPEAPSDPPPAGMRFDFDARGFVRATPDGAMTPEGVRVVAGSPPLTPPADMAQSVTVTAQIPVTNADADAQAGAATQTETVVFTGNPALATIRPRARPENALAGESGAEQEESDAGQVPDAPVTRIAGEEDAQSAPASTPSLAALRPQPRPQEMTAAAATLQTASAASTVPLVDGAALTRALTEASAQPQTALQTAAQATLQTTPQTGTQPDDEELDDAAFDNATPQAVTASLTPIRRPGDFDTTVKRARAETAAQPVPQSQQMQVSLPSSTSVARQATEKDVLKLRDVNLIGVYGSASSRRALVRLGNGRYQKVRVGDSLDGGQVAAIGEGELRYIKRGRNVVLRMPQG